MRGREALGYATVAALAIIPSLFLSLISVVPRTTPAFIVFTMVIAVPVIVLRPVWLVITRHPAPLRQLRKDLLDHWGWIVAGLVCMLSVAQTFDTSLQFKRLIPSHVPYYADPALIEIDRVLFFGHDAWEATHAVFGKTATQVINTFYGFWHFSQLCLLVVISLTPNRRFQLRAALTFQLAWLLLGALMATAAASVGPCFVDDFYGRDDFAPLMATLAESDIPLLFVTMDYLLEAQGRDAIGSGISAMPSLHVGIVVLIALCLKGWTRWLGWGFAVITYIGSIHLGWHYATDGIVSAIAVVLLWKAMGWFVDRLMGDEAAEETPAPVAK